jgi:hypothetical protein
MKDLDITSFKSAARRLNSFANIGYLKSLEALSRALYNRSWEEISAKIGAPATTDSGRRRYFLTPFLSTSYQGPYSPVYEGKNVWLNWPMIALDVPESTLQFLSAYAGSLPAAPAGVTVSVRLGGLGCAYLVGGLSAQQQKLVSGYSVDDTPLELTKAQYLEIALAAPVHFKDGGVRQSPEICTESGFELRDGSIRWLGGKANTYTLMSRADFGLLK